MPIAPDYVEPLIGWRAWHIVPTPDGPRLHSIGRDVTWQPGREHHASCRRHQPWLRRRRAGRGHAAPATSCSCGVWAVQTPTHAASALDIYGRSWKPIHRVLGRVSLWGTIVEHDRGWRAELAYPAELFIPRRRLHGPDVPDVDALAQALSAYDVPIHVVEAGARGTLARELTTLSA